MQYTELRNPPIEEMILSVKFQEVIDEEGVRSFLSDKSINDSFEIPVPASNLENWTHLIDSSFVSKPDKEKVIKLKLDSFTYHRLQYVKFETFLEEFLSYWNIIQQYTAVSSIAGISVRYINVIGVNDEEIEVERFTKVYIESNLEVENSNFFLQLNVAKKGEANIRGVITETLGIVNGKKGIIVDIRVDSTSKYENDAEIIKSALFDMREFKNYLFYNTVTEHALEAYK